jgi:hypothetical protein
MNRCARMVDNDQPVWGVRGSTVHKDQPVYKNGIRGWCVRINLCGVCVGKRGMLERGGDTRKGGGSWEERHGCVRHVNVTHVFVIA